MRPYHYARKITSDWQLCSSTTSGNPTKQQGLAHKYNKSSALDRTKINTATAWQKFIINTKQRPQQENSQHDQKSSGSGC
jgi:hypothetical protein